MEQFRGRAYSERKPIAYSIRNDQFARAFAIKPGPIAKQCRPEPVLVV